MKLAVFFSLAATLAVTGCAGSAPSETAADSGIAERDTPTIPADASSAIPMLYDPSAHSDTGNDVAAGSGGDGAEDEAETDAETPAATSYCDRAGPPLLIDGMGESACGGRIAEQVFRYALCTCEDYVTNAGLTTDSYDSLLSVEDQAGASVGTNGSFHAADNVSVGGSIIVSSTDGLTLLPGTPALVGGHLRTNGPLRGDDTVDVTGDALIAGDIDGVNLIVGGELSNDPGLTVEEPCACGDNDIVDIGGYVQQHRELNDNATIDLDADALLDNGERTLVLPCGRFFLDGIAEGGSVVIRTEGRAALFIASDVSLSSSLSIEVGPESEIDVFIEGNLRSSGGLHLGNAENAGRVRLYVGGTDPIYLSANSNLGGNLYAPRAELSVSSSLEVFGAVFVRRLTAASPVSIHYDETILRAADECLDLPESPDENECSSCGECRASQACVGGQCGACQTDADCCQPLTCAEGTCVPRVVVF